MSFVMETDTRKDNEVVEVRGESENTTYKEAEVTQKFFLIPIPPPPFHRC